MLTKNNLFLTGVVVVSVLLFNIHQQSEASSSGFSFDGVSRISLYYSDHQHFGQSIPSEYLSWQLRSRLTLFHIPLQVSSLLSTQQGAGRQSINHLSVSLDTRSLLRHIDTSGTLRFFRHFETMELGRTRPAYSPLMLHGIPVTGVNVSMRIRGAHAAFVYGNSKRAVRRGTFLSQQHKQKILFGRIGVGSLDATFFNFSVLHAKDDRASIEPTGHYYHWPADTLVHHMDTLFIAPDSAAVYRRPGESLLPGVEFGFGFFGKKLQIRAEAVGMVHTSNTESDAIEIGSLPSWIDRVHPIRLTSAVSYAYGLTKELRLSTTRVNASYQVIAPGFYSPGTPLLRQDRELFRMSVSQSLFNRKFTIQPHFRWFRDNLSNHKTATTETLIWGITGMWRPANLPYLSFSYSPHKQELQHDTHPVVNTAQVTTVSTGRNYTVSNQLQAFTGFSWSNQQTSIKNIDQEREFRGNNFSLQQSLRLTIPLNLMANIGLYMMETEGTSTSTRQYMLRGTYDVQEAWRVSLGIRHFNRGGESKRTGIRFQTSYDFGRFGALELLAEPLYYRDILNPEREYDQYIVRITFINKW